MKKRIFTFQFILLFLCKAVAQGGDNCATALANPSSLPFTYTNQSTCTATNDYTIPSTSSSCLSASSFAGKDWVYYFCAAQSGFVQILVNNITPVPANSFTNASVSVFNNCPTSSGSCIGGNVAFVFGSTPGSTSIVAAVTAGQCYYILLDGNSSSTPTCYNYSISANLIAIPTQTSCTNMDFESGNLSGWFATSGRVKTGCSTCTIGEYVIDSIGVSNLNHLLVSNGNDPFGGFPRVSPGGNYSLRLGNGNTGAKAASIQQRFIVAPNNSSFLYRYAVVFEDPNHSAIEQPFFSAKILDQNGNLIPCSKFEVSAAGNIPGFLNSSSNANVKYKDWTDVTVDLSAYVGQMVSIEFTTGDCSLGGHFGYAYVDASCSRSELNNKDSICLGDSVTLVGPLGFKNYLWTPGNFTTKDIKVSPSSNTIYTLNALGFNNCSIQYSDTIIVITPPTFSVTNPVTMTNCNAPPLTLNFNTTSSNVTVNWTGPGIVSGANTFTPNVNLPGTYNVYISRGPCKDTSVVFVLAGPAFPNANAGSPQAFTCNTNSLMLNGSSSSLTTSVNWIGPGIVSGGNTFTPTINAPGIYTIIVTNASNCSNTDTVLVLPQPPLPNANAGPDKTIDCIVNTITLNGSSTTVGATISWSGPGLVSGSTTFTPIVNVSGQYILSINLPNGCEKKDTVIVNPKPSLPNSSAGNDQKINCSTNTINLNGNSTSSGVIVLWSGPGIVSGANSFSPTVNLPGNYIITVTDQNNCFSSDTVNISPSGSKPVASLIITKQPDCIDTSGSIQINVLSPQGNYYITGDAIAFDSVFPINISNQFTGNQTYIVTDSNGCSDTVTAVINAPPAGPAAISNVIQQPNCIINTGQLQLSITSGIGPFNINGSANFTNIPLSTLTLNAIPPGPKLFVIKDIAGCKTIIYDTITNVPIPIVASISSVIQPTCSIQSGTVNISLNSGLAPFSISGSTTNSFASFPFLLSGQTSGLKTYYIIDANFCKDTITALVNPAPLIPNPVINVIQQPTCTNPNGTIQIQVNNSSGPYIISGDTNMTTLNNPITIPNQSAGLKSYTVAISSGCDALVNTTINLPPLTPSSNAGLPKILTCNNPTATLNGSSLSSGATASWTGPGIVNGANSFTPSVNLPGTYILSVSENGCSSVASVAVSLASKPIGILSTQSKAICNNNNIGLLNINGVNGGVSPYSISINGSNPTNTLPFTLTNLSGGNYNVQLIDQNGCTLNKLITIPNINSPSAISSSVSNVTCYNGKNGSINIQAQGSSPLTYIWSPSNLNALGQNSVSNLKSGQYSLIITDTNNCSSPFSFTITEPTAIQTSITSNTAFCKNTNVLLNAQSLGGSGSNYSYRWQMGNITLATANTLNFQINNTATLMIITKDGNACIDTTYKTIIPQSPNITTVIPNSKLCAPNCISLNSGPLFPKVVWDFGDGSTKTGNIAKHCYQEAGLYSVTLKVEDGQGCKSSKTFNNIIEVFEKPKVKISADPIVTPISSPEITFAAMNTNSIPVIKWNWEFQDIPIGVSSQQNPKYSFNQPGIHQIELITTNTYGCKDTSYIEVNLEYVFKFHTANAFTPNDDIHNNIWLPKGIGIDKNQYLLQIFSKWGQKLFESNVMDAGWDGKVDGKLVNEDNYVWQVDVKDLNGKSHLLRGNILVMH